MISLAFLIRIIVTLGCIMMGYWSLQCIHLEKIILKNRLKEAQLMLVLLAVWMGIGVANAIFSLTDYINSVIQLTLNR